MKTHNISRHWNNLIRQSHIKQKDLDNILLLFQEYVKQCLVNKYRLFCIRLKKVNV